MDYIIALIVIVVLVPLIILLVARRGGGGAPSKDHGLTPGEPAADEPTPRPGPGVDPHIPPS